MAHPLVSKSNDFDIKNLRFLKTAGAEDLFESSQNNQGVNPPLMNEG